MYILSVSQSKKSFSCHLWFDLMMMMRQGLVVFDFILLFLLFSASNFRIKCGLLGKADQYYFQKIFGNDRVLEERNVNQNSKSSDLGIIDETNLLTKIKNIDVEQNVTNFMSLMDDKFYFIDDEVAADLMLKNKEARLNNFKRYRPIDIKALIVPYVEKKFQLIIEKKSFDESTPESRLSEWLKQYNEFQAEISRLSQKIIMNNLNEYVNRYRTIYMNRLGATIRFGSNVNFNNSQILKFILTTKIQLPEHQFYSLKQLHVANKLLSLISDSIRLLLENDDKKHETNLVLLKFFVNNCLMELSTITKLNTTILSDDLNNFEESNSFLLTDKSIINNLKLRLDLETKLLNPSFLQLE